MNLPLCAAATALAVGLCSCDSRVLIGYVPDHPGSAQDAGARDTGMPLEAATLDARSMTIPDAGMDATRRDANLDQDAGMDRGSDPLPKITWRSGAHSGNEEQSYVDFGTWRGRPLDLANLFPDRLHGWDGIVNPGWPVDMFSMFQGQLLLSVPLYPEGGSNNNQDCATGAYDSQWRKLGAFLTAHNRADTIIRLGWGENDLTHPWRADADPSDWITCFRRVVTQLRASDPSVLIDWSFNPVGAPNIMAGDPFAAYPGDAYVDFIGIEAYDRYPPSATIPQWNANCVAPTGLCTVIQFTRKHGKKLGIAEWGIASCGGDAGGDSAYFVERMVRTFADNADIMGYEAYFEDDGTEVCSGLSDGNANPKASAMYREIYSAR